MWGKVARTHLDGAVAEAAEQWLGHPADRAAYQELISAILARRAALSAVESETESEAGPVEPRGLIPLPRQPSGRHRDPHALTPTGPATFGALAAPDNVIDIRRPVAQQADRADDDTGEILDQPIWTVSDWLGTD